MVDLMKQSKQYNFKILQMTTKVKFLYHEGNQDLMAYFPEEVWCDNTKTCYSHIGQHSACHPNYAKECREATMLEYLDLFNELQSIGYRLELV
jgi:hypothetical protein